MTSKIQMFTGIAVVVISLLANITTYSDEVVNNIPVVINNDRITDLTIDWDATTGEISSVNQAINKFRIKINPSVDLYKINDLKNYDGIMWYRLLCKFKDKNDYSVLIPPHHGGIRVYFNGKIIFNSCINLNCSIIGKTTVVDVPASEIRDINEFIIQKGSFNNNSSFNGRLLIGPANDIDEMFIGYIIKISFMSSISLFISIYFILMYFKRRSSKYFLYFSILSASMGFWGLGYSSIILWVFNNGYVYILSTYLSSILIPMSLLMFLFEFFSYKKSNILKTINTVLLSFIIALIVEILLTGGIKHYNKYMFDLFLMISFMSLIYCLGVSIKATYDDIKYSIRIVSSILVAVVSSILSMLVFTEVIKISPPVLEGYFIMTFIMATVLASQFSQVHTDLEKAHSDLLVLDKMKDDFLATTSHELRTPLHGIIGLTESLADGSLGQVSGAQKENLELIRSSASHLTALVNEILDFSRLRAGRADLYLEKTRVEDIAATVVSLLKQSAAQKGVRLELDAKTAPEISADRNRLRQVLINLVGNAVKFTEKGEIRVVVEPSPGGGVRVTVRDTGRGIEARDLARMWNPFEQAEDPDTRSTGGTGLGLAITKYLVELHGGTIRAESEFGKGSVFIFELPAEPSSRGIQKAGPAFMPALEKNVLLTPGLASTGAEAKETYGPRRGLSSAEILAVDDDPVSLKVVENLCRVVGYNIVTASSGSQALAILEERDIDLVLLDLMLPGMSGFEVCYEMRTRERLQHVPVIMVTARDAAGDLIRGFTTGANDYVTKPFNREELLVRMENQLVIKQMLDMEKSVINSLRQEKDAITSLYRRSQDLKESTLQMVEWERIVREDLHIAESFQHRLMTHEKGIRGLESHVLYRPLMQIGGDLYDIFEYRPDVARVFLADATGHGITASLNTVKILSEYAAVKETLSSPEVVLNYLNRRFIQIFSDYQIVFTCMVADIDLITGRVSVVSAGHPEAYRLGSDAVEPIKPRGPIIGLSKDYEYRQSETTMATGDILFLYTDGLLELIDAQYKRAAGPDFDEADIMKRRLAWLNKDRPLDEICGLVMNPPEEDVPVRGRNNDDITIIALRRG